MIICFNDKINTFSKININNFSLTQEHIQELMPSCEDIHCNCPNCKAKSNFSFHGSYVRNISFIRENKIYDFKVTVTRVICNSCGSTHALLPSFIVPYKIFLVNLFCMLSLRPFLPLFSKHLKNKISLFN